MARWRAAAHDFAASQASERVSRRGRAAVPLRWEANGAAVIAVVLDLLVWRTNPTSSEEAWRDDEGDMTEMTETEL